MLGLVYFREEGVMAGARLLTVLLWALGLRVHEGACARP